MNILLVEDNKIKKRAIETSLIKIRPESRIRHIGNLADAEHYVDVNADNIDLLVLDWCFPENRDARAKEAAGKDMLDYLANNNIFIKTIICSGNIMNEDELKPYYFLLGAVQFGKGNPGEQINEVYLDYWAKFSSMYVRPVNINDGPKVKKLVNYDVK